MTHYTNIFPIDRQRIKQLIMLFPYLYRKFFIPTESFKLGGKEYLYYSHPYNNTWKNERCVEVPVVWDLVQQYHPNEVLEIGNVLSHYFSVKHDIVDKYERGRGVINQDIVDLDFDKKYRLIVSISTLEHVGWDEVPKEPGKHLRAIDSILKCLAPDGLFLTTLPIGYNPDLDKDIEDGKITFKEVDLMKRTSETTWVESDWEEVKGAKFGDPYKTGNGLVFGVMRN
jgi:hypothetical protein